MYAVAASASLDKKTEQACLALTTSASKLCACVVGRCEASQRQLAQGPRANIM